MKRGGSKAYDYDDEDDYYYDDDEDYDYDDDGSYTKTDPKPGAKHQHQSKQNQQQEPPAAAVTAPATNNKRSWANDDDADVIDSMIPVLTTALASISLRASAFKEDLIVQHLRESNYDVDVSVSKLKHIAPLDARIPEGGGNNAAASPAPKKSKTLVLGGGSKKNADPPVAAVVAQPAKPEAQQPAVEQEAPAAATAAATAAASSSSSKALKGAHGAALPKCELTSDVTVGQSGKTNISVVVTGHVDHGKSTMIGNLLYQLGQFTDKDVHKMEQAAKRAGKSSFHYAWLLDQSDEERRRGVTIDSGVHSFETDHHTVSVLDAPGHESFVENMASSSAQADLALLVVSAKPEELSVGLDYGTRLHANILRRLGVPRVVICVNKMDAVEFDEGAFRNASDKATELLVKAGFSKGDIVGSVPLSGLAGINLTEKPAAASPMSKWHKDGPTLIDVIDSVQAVPRMLNFPLRFVVSDVQRSSVAGKIECGTVSIGDSILFHPSNAKITVRSMEHSVVGPVKVARAGDQVDITTSSDISAVSVGNIGCPLPKGGTSSKDSFPPCHVAQSFEAIIQTYGANARAILPGYRCVIMINATQVQATVKQLLSKMNMTTGQWSPRGGMVKLIPRETQGLVLVEVEYPIAFERGDDCRNLGRFLIRQEGDIIGGGVIETPIFPDVAAAAPAVVG